MRVRRRIHNWRDASIENSMSISYGTDTPGFYLDREFSDQYARAYVRVTGFVPQFQKYRANE